MKNRLQHENSPYLLQHQDNPVDWWAWSDGAFDAAQEQDKPIFLSIGYATCHWCHVMAHESFEDEAVARLMNETFINIKVDREERPDIDNLYMTVCQMMTGHGGWPLTIVMMPDKRPFFAATYIPKHTRHGRLGMLDLVPRLQQAWREDRDKILASAEDITGFLKASAAQPGADRSLDKDALPLAYSHIQRRFDAKHGGFGTAPKFPSPHTLLFLLRYGQRTGETAALHMVETTLQQMRLGGIYDQLGFGFHRYATDAAWKVPHFEKMLYDQAMLAMAYVETFEATGKAVYETVAREIFTYILRDMTAPESGFYSAEDADSEGREGVFYLWTPDEIRAVLDDDLAEMVIKVYNVEEGGNFEEEASRQRTGENILFLKRPLAEMAAGLAMGEKTLRARLEEARHVLFDHREARIHPQKDDKVLVDWNGLMIAAFAKAARVFDETAYTEAAERAARFILSTLRRTDGGLLHRYRNGDAAIPGTIDDYAFFVWGLLELYETTFDMDYLREAMALNDYALAHLWDNDYGGFFFSADEGGDLIARQKEAYDGAVPSGNSVAMLNLLRLSRLTGNTDLEVQADAIGRYFAEVVMKQPAGFTAMLLALDFAVGPSFEVVIAGDPRQDDTQAMLQALRRVYLPRKVVLLRNEDNASALAQLVPYTEAQHMLDGRATAYVCRNFACEQPTTDPVQMLATLGVNAKS